MVTRHDLFESYQQWEDEEDDDEEDADQAPMRKGSGSFSTSHLSHMY